jgi:transketolase
VAWNAAISRPASLGMAVADGGPSALLLSRQNLPFVARDAATVAAIARGGYVLRDAAAGMPAQALIIATGSEVGIALAAQEQLGKEGIGVRVVSMPCTQVFDQQDDDWKESVLPYDLPRLAIEAGVTDGWYKYVGLDGVVIGIDRYGESAPAGALFKFFGLTADKVADAIKQIL